MAERRDQRMAEAPALPARPRPEPPCVALQSPRVQGRSIPPLPRLHEQPLYSKRYVKALPPVDQPGGRGRSRKRHRDEETLPDGPLRGPSPSHRQQRSRSGAGRREART
eukprot:scaffold142884_cov127-Phaeocystis_antarctica.AAC.1